ncbi:MAG TPA: translocation/assembly module TamB domain-containing protein [Gemmatimonadaceae bacterium]|nr:translocation/assembly module TamB domain-containing protein [Gemmatimonadaceae bacterium]
MGRLAKWLGILVALVIAVIVLNAAALWILTHTDWGRTRVKNIALGGMEKVVHGKTSIRRVSGGLLSNITLEHVVITDSSGAPFISVDSITTDYSIGDLFRKRILLDHSVFVRPNVVLDKNANGEWNYARILPGLIDTTKKPPNLPPQPAGWGDWIRAADVRIVDGRLLIVSPWAPAKNLSRAAADSAVRDAVSGRSRAYVERTATGLRRRIEIDSINGRLPLVRISQPGQPSSVAEVGNLAMNAYFVRPPGGRFRNLTGTFAFNTDSIWWASASTTFPRGSKAAGSGSFVFGSGDMTLTLRSDNLVFDDVRWAYLPLPPEARGKMNFALKWRGLTQDYVVSSADVTLRQARATGNFGITLDDSVTIHDTDLRFSGIDTKVLSDLIPGVTIPRTGVFAGRATVRGGRRVMIVKGNLTFDDRSAGRNRFLVEGQIGVLNGNGIRLRDLRVQMFPLQVAMLRTWRPGLPIDGVINGTTTLNGTTATQIAMNFEVTHDDRGNTSAFSGSAVLHTRGPTHVDVDIVAYPISLAEVGRFAPAVGLRGKATGPIHLHGPLSALRIDTDLRTPDGGRVATKGTVDMQSQAIGYDLASTLTAFNLSAVQSKAPVTSLTGTVTAVGRGTDLPTLTSKVAADLSGSHVIQGADSIGIDSLSLRATAANGDAKIQRLVATAEQTRATASGGIGLVSNKIDSLRYTVIVDSLGALNRWFPKSNDSTPVTPRPAVVARIMAEARADSARIAKRTEMERMVHGRPPPRLVVNKPRPIPRDTMVGRLYLAGTLRGNLDNFELRGRAEGDTIIARGNTVHHVTSTYAWKGGRKVPSTLSISADAVQLSAMGFGFDTATARFTYASGAPEDPAVGGRGHVEVALVQRDTAGNRHYTAKGDYALFPDRRELRVAQLSLQLDSTTWASPHPDTVQWGKAGIRVGNFQLTNGVGGRVRVNGLVPTTGVANLSVDVDSFPVGNVVDLLQSDVTATGFFALHGNVQGTSSAPTFGGRFYLSNAEYNAAPFPDLVGRVSYADERFVTHIDVNHLGFAPLMTVDARLPLNLAFTDVKGSRILPGPLSIDVTGDSLPVDLIPDLTDLVTDVHGRAAGHFAVRGTFKNPELSGLVLVQHGTTTIASAGSTIGNIGGTIRMAGDSIYLDQFSGDAGGAVRLSGALSFTNWREPSFNLALVSEGARLINNDYADLNVDTHLTLKGPFKKATVGGDVTVTRGIIYIPESSQRSLVGPGDPGLFNVVDTTSELAHRLFPAQSPLLANLSFNVAVRINQNTWVRNREANIEIYTSDPLIITDSSQALTIRGVITTERGDYTLLTKRFQIRRGTATFVGAPGLNPSLQVTGEYQVNQATRGAVNIRVLIGGTLDQPNLSLESDAQPPRSQSELLTLIAFGQSTSSLIASNSSSVASAGTTTDVVGAGAQFVARRLATVAVGVMTEQAQIQAGRALRADVFTITPADAPLEAGTGGIPGFITQTKFEAGKYITPQTFVSLQTQARNLGAAVERRTQDGWRITVTVEPQVVLLEPQLNSQPRRTLTSAGIFVIRDWRF